MADVTVRRTEDFETTYGGAMVKVRAGLGVTSFGMQVLRLPANLTAYPAHDHSDDGQEEVYTVLEGAATLSVDGEEHELTPGTFARVGPDERRTLVTGDVPVAILVLGGVPGQPYEIVPVTEEGAPDPFDG